MKGSLEFAIVFLVGCFMLTLLIQFASAITSIHQGHLYLNYVMHLTENYDGNLVDVKNHVASNRICKDCSYTHTLKDDRYEIDVRFPLTIPALGYVNKIKISGLTSVLE